MTAPMQPAEGGGAAPAAEAGHPMTPAEAIARIPAWEGHEVR